MAKRARANQFQLEGAVTLRNQAREHVSDRYPMADIDVQLATGETGTITVAARIIGDPSPHSPEQITSSLGQLGIHEVSLVSPPEASGTTL
jgi:hypothetical protein